MSKMCSLTFKTLVHSNKKTTLYYQCCKWIQNKVVQTFYFEIISINICCLFLQTSYSHRKIIRSSCGHFECACICFTYISNCFGISVWSFTSVWSHLACVVILCLWAVFTFSFFICFFSLSLCICSASLSVVVSSTFQQELFVTSNKSVDLKDLFTDPTVILTSKLSITLWRWKELAAAFFLSEGYFIA